MSSEFKYPEYSEIEAHIRRARLERNIAVAKLIADGGEALSRGLKRVTSSILGGFENARNARAVEADAFFKRSVPRY